MRKRMAFFKNPMRSPVSWLMITTAMKKAMRLMVRAKTSPCMIAAGIVSIRFVTYATIPSGESSISGSPFYCGLDYDTI
jgi:hypothetical protein